MPATPHSPAEHADASPTVLRLARAALAAAAVWAAWLLVGRADYVPIWDGRIYADCYVAAARALSVGALRCAQHPSHAYVAILAVVQRLSPGSFALMLATNAALLVATVAAFAVVLRRAFPSPALAPERALLIAALVVHPVILANVVQPGLDFGVLTFFMAAVAAAVTRRVWLLAAFGVMAAFSKESGVLMYVALAACYALARLLPRPVPRDLALAGLGAVLMLLFAVGGVPAWPLGLLVGIVVAVGAFVVMRPRALPAAYAPRALLATLRPALRWLVPLALPVVAFAAYLAYRATLPVEESVLWGGEGGGSVLRTLLTPHLGRTVWSYLALLTVLGFLWLPTIPLVADLLIGVRRFVRQLPRRMVPGSDPEVVLFVSWLSAAAVYLLTRYVTFANVRYLLPAYPLLLLLTLAALLRLGVAARWRVAGLATLTALLVVSNVRTADPISRALWGTFPVGAHDLLRITSLTGECCGSGRDQLTYNLQFTAFDDVGRSALASIQPIARRRALGAPSDADWFVVGPLDAWSRRTLAEPDSLGRMTYAPDWPRGRPAPDSLWYLGYPFIDQEPVLRAARSPAGGSYELVRTDTARAGGYAMPVLLLVRRGAATAAATAAGGG